FYYFTISYAGAHRDKKILAAAFILSFIMVPLFIWSDLFLDGVYSYEWGYYPKAGAFHPLYLLAFFSMVLRGFVLLYNNYRENLTRLSMLDRKHIKYITAGFAIALLASVDYLPNYGVGVYPVGFAFISLFSCVIAYAIMRYGILNIRIVLKKQKVYSIAAGMLTGLFVVLVLTITNVISVFNKVDSFMVNVFAALVITFLFNPLRHKIHKLVDSLFFKKTYDYYATVQQVSATLVPMLELQRIYKFVSNIIYEVLGLQGVCLMSPGSDGMYENVFSISYSDDNRWQAGNTLQESDKVFLTEECDIIRALYRSREILLRDNFGNNNESGCSDSGCNKMFEKLKRKLGCSAIEAVVPVFVDSKLVLVLIAGERLSGDMFTEEDVNLLSTIAEQAATAIKHAQLYLEKVQSERLASIGMMSATFAHEIRNPLTSLKTFAQLMPEKYNDEEFRNTFSKIVVGEIERIDGLIEDLLDFSMKKKTPGIDYIDVTNMVDGVVDYVMEKLAMNKQNIHIEKMYNKKSVPISGDAKQLKQAILNVIDNGCQAMHGTGVLKVFIKPNFSSVDIEIMDNGEGIHPDYLKDIFNPFVTSKEMGVGLGLAISERIIDDHGGTILVNSRYTEGSTFTITLPISHDMAEMVHG
ncbi:hypothetical protein H8E50_13150, partial [bacterium]|nr:hypothetical protein [bacterium]